MDNFDVELQREHEREIADEVLDGQRDAMRDEMAGEWDQEDVHGRGSFAGWWD